MADLNYLRTILANGGADAPTLNAIRALLDRGEVSNQDLSQMPMSGSAAPPQNALSQALDAAKPGASAFGVSDQDRAANRQTDTPNGPVFSPKFGDLDHELQRVDDKQLTPQELVYRDVLSAGAGDSGANNRLDSFLKGQLTGQPSTGDLRKQGANFVRNESTGQTIYLGPNGQASDQPTSGAQAEAQAQPARMMQVIGTSGGSRVTLSPEQAPDKVNLDYSQNPLQLFGGAKAIYSKDEPGVAYVMGDDGKPKTKVLLGYDLQGSMALNKANMEMAKDQAQIGQTQAATEHTQEETRASKLNNPDFAAGGGAGAPSLQSMDPGTAATVKQMLEGRMPFPGNMALRSPRVMQLLNAANQIDPSFDATTWKRRADTADEFAKGKSYQAINALNTVSGHLDTFDKAVDALNNTNYPAVNSVINPIAQQLGSTKQTDFATTLKTLAPELERAYRGAGGSESSIEAWRTALSGNNGYDQQKSAIRQLAGLLHSKIDALGYSYSQGMNKSSNGYDLLSPAAQSVFSKLSGMNEAPSGQSSGQPQGAPSMANSLPLPTDKTKLVAGQTYRTARGPARWNGSAFEG